MFFWYRFFTYLFYPFSPIYLFFRRIKKKEDSNSYREKLSKIKISREDGFLIWFHVASVGESMSILPLIENCIKEKKINKILLTSITLSSGKILKKRFSQNTKVIHQFLPLDVPILVKKFLQHWKPNLLILIDSEIWPNLILQTFNKKIPLLLLNARITKKSFKRWKLGINFAKKIFNKFDLCIASNKDSENFLKVLGAKNIKNYGNLKFSSVKNTSNKNLDSNFLNKVKNRNIWCGASTHEPEELLCAMSHIEVKKSYSNILTVIIPRHIERIEKIKKKLSSLNLKIDLYSKWDQVDSSTDIILVDVYGETSKFYNISKSAFIGKSTIQSLIKTSGQNPIEAARIGCKIFHGPNVSNFSEIYEYLKTQDITKEIKNVDELSRALIGEFEKDEAKNNNIKEKIDDYGQNILNNVFEEVKKYI
jgi:3-deoxy-D-manno-octulosonic-acid transferase